MAERTPDPARPFVDRAERLFADLGLAEVRAWKDKHPGRPALGHLPVYAPRELLAACETLPACLTGQTRPARRLPGATARRLARSEGGQCVHQ